VKREVEATCGTDEDAGAARGAGWGARAACGVSVETGDVCGRVVVS
jgi:hypothetical protein